MKMTCASFFPKVLRDQEGQAIVWLVLALSLVMMGVGGLTIDLGRFYALRTQLQNSTNAAGLAATGNAFRLDSTSAIQAEANTFAADNPVGGLTQNQGYPIVAQVCLNQLEQMTSGLTCTSTNNVPNALKVTEQVTMPTAFMRWFGVKSLTVQTTATAALVGVAQPINLAIIVDSTGSMNTADTNCGTSTEFQCALQGVQTMLAETNPVCPISTQCPTGYKVRVALFTFPNVSTATAHMDIDCNAHATALPYTLPLPSATSYAPMTYTQKALPHTTWTATYEITYNLQNDPTVTTNAASDADANGFVTDYYDPNQSGGLNHSSSLVQAIGYGTTPGCLSYTQGIVNSGMGNTYFAGAIYAAQSALLAEQASNPGSINKLIYLSDGQANLFKNQFPDNTSASTSVGCNAGIYSGGNYSLTTCGTSTAAQTGAVYLTPASISSTLGYDTLSSDTVASGQSRSGTTIGIYPDYWDQCQQAIAAAQYAATYPNNPTTVYGVAYGSEVGGCSTGWNLGLTDTTLVDTGVYNVSIGSSSPPTLIPCTTVEDIASSLTDFYSDFQQSGSNVDSNCVSAQHPYTSMQIIFKNIQAGFAAPRLISNSLT